jgi:hypothetical protein
MEGTRQTRQFWKYNFEKKKSKKKIKEKSYKKKNIEKSLGFGGFWRGDHNWRVFGGFWWVWRVPSINLDPF